MKIAALKERAKGELRAAISPDTTKLFIRKGFKVFVEKGIGESAGFTDSMYKEAGASVSNVPLEIASDADIILKVQPSPITDEINEVALASKNAIIIGMLSPHSNAEYLSAASKHKLTCASLELLPRITKTQNMDVLSSQTNLAGYRAVIEASYHFNRAFPMMMTAAGSLAPAKVLILGAGVAGLQAIATAKRLGAAVSAFDVRSATKEQIESLGAKFVSPGLDNKDMETKSGYAKEASLEDKQKQAQFLANTIPGFDIIITTAQIPGKPAPRLVTTDMVKTMKHGSVIVDMSTMSGGNVEGSETDKIIIKDGVTIIGWSNLASRVAFDSSKLYAKNLYNLLDYIVQDNKIDFHNDVMKEILVVKNGEIINRS